MKVFKYYLQTQDLLRNLGENFGSPVAASYMQIFFLKISLVWSFLSDIFDSFNWYNRKRNLSTVRFPSDRTGIFRGRSGSKTFVSDIVKSWGHLEVWMTHLMLHFRFFWFRIMLIEGTKHINIGVLFLSKTFF